MKAVVKAALFLTLVSCFCSSTQGQVSKESSNKSKPKLASGLSRKYDKSSDTTTIRVKSMTVSRLTQEKEIANNIPLHQMDLEISYSYNGKDPTVGERVVELTFHSVAGNYVFLRGQPGIAVLDRNVSGKDRLISLGVTSYKSAAPKFNSVYEEFMSMNVAPAVISKLTECTMLEFFLGPVGYRLTPEQHDRIREFAKLITLSPSLPE